jgi:dethiobiotin synthase
MRLYICGTDTDVGKTTVVRLLARALDARGDDVTVVKLVQTGVTGDEPGDAALAVAGTRARACELARFAKPSDAWTAALAEGRPTVDPEALARAVRAIGGTVLVEGSGGAAVPVDASETISTIAARAGLRALLVVGLRLGCINHALLTQRYLASLGLPILGFVLVDRWDAGAAYAEEVARVLRNFARILGVVAFGADEAPAMPGDLLLRTISGALHDDDVHFD